MRFQPVLRFLRTPPNLHILILAIVGLALAFIIPPFQAPDEQTHLYRAYGISEGHLLARHLPYGAGDRLPGSLSRSFTDYNYLMFQPDNKLHRSVLSHGIHTPLKTHELADTRFENTAIYPPLAYVPQAIGILIGRLFSASPVILLYLARLANVAAWIGLLWLTMKRNPRFRVALFAFGLIPIVAFQASSASADVLTTGLTVALVFEVFRLATTGAVTWRSARLAVILAAVLSLCKFPYAFVSLTALAIPAKQFAARKERWLIPAIIITAAVLPSLLWFAYSQHAFVNLRAGVDSAAQLHGIIHHPYAFLVVLYNTYLTYNSDLLYIQMVGQLGWLDTKLPFWVILSSALAVILSLLAIRTVQPKLVLLWWQRWLALIIMLLLVGLVSTALYMTWDPPFAKIIDGLQGRYYAPLFGLAAIALAGLLGLTAQQSYRASRIVYGLSGVSMAATVITLLIRYYPV